MTKIIREKYEAGVLIAREVEENGSNAMEIAKLGVLIVIAVAVVAIAALNLRDSLAYSGLVDQSGVSDSACHGQEYRS